MRNPAEADGSHIFAFPQLVASIFGVVFAVSGFPFLQILLLRLRGVNLRITRNSPHGNLAGADGSRWNPYPRLLPTRLSIFGVFFWRFWLSVSPNPPPSTPGDKFTDGAKPHPGRPGGSRRKLTAAKFPPTSPTWLLSFLVSFLPFLAFRFPRPLSTHWGKFTDYAKPPPRRPGGI